VRLEVEDRGAGEQAGAAAAQRVDGERLVGVGRLARGGVARGARDRLVEPPPRDRLAQVVDGGELERVDGGVVERRDEDHGGRALEAAQHARDLEAVEAGHADVEEHGVDAALGERHQRLLGRGRGVDAVDGRRRREQPHEVLERWQLVVDREDPHAARTPARNFGSVITTVVPRPSPDCTCRP
jgi:hypothetical protein